jgi:hypothetical protein
MRFQESRLRRFLHGLCILFVVGYILFDVLDLDGSRLPSVMIPLDQSFIAAEPPAVVEPSHRPDRVGLWESVVVDNGPHTLVLPAAFRLPLFSPLDSARTHHYRVGLPRDAIIDPN